MQVGLQQQATGSSEPIDERKTNLERAPSRFSRVKEISDFLRMGPFLFTEDRIRNHGKHGMYMVKTGIYNMLLLSGLDGLKAFYNTDLVARHGGFPIQTIFALHGRILNMIDDQQYRDRRRIVMHALADPSLLQQAIPSLQLIIDRYLNKWNSIKNFQWTHENHLLVGELTCSWLLDITDPKEMTETSVFLTEHISTFLKGVTAIPIPLPWSNYSKAVFASTKVRNFLMKQVELYMEKIRNGDSQTNSVMFRFCSELMQQNTNSQKDLVTEIYHSIIASIALIGNAFTNTLIILKQLPQLQQQLKDEIVTQLGSALRSNYSLEELSKLQLMESVLNEIRRLYPLIAGMIGITKKEFQVNDIMVEKGTRVVGCFYVTNHDPNIYDQPYEFKADRFLGKDVKMGNLFFGYVPHGTAHHRCPGEDGTTMILKLCLVHLLLRNSTWGMPAQDLTQNMNLFNPEPKSGCQVNNFSTQ